MKIALLLANGFEEIEALLPLDMLRRAGCVVDTVGIGGRQIVGAHGIRVLADKCDGCADISDYGAVILPGGMPGATNLDNSEFTDRLIDSVVKKGGRLAAICAAPLVLGHRGLLRGKRAVCYPGFEGELEGALVLDTGVVTDGNITTARGMGVALAFAEELVSLFAGKETAERISASIMKENQ
ncbi:MAG: DJ-1/PfpI family protein [Clostridia bacterium]|nr:DJ-1/PfpI family protein [Clostridia bacterium]